VITLPVRLAVALTVVALAASACGSSTPNASQTATASSSSTAATPTAGATTTPAATTAAVAAGGAFCDQLKVSQVAVAGQESAFAKSVIAGSFPSIKSSLSIYFHQLLGNLAAVEASMGNVSANVQAAVITVNKTYAKLVAAVDGATSLSQMSASFAALGKDPALRPALATLKTWGEGQCGN